MLFSVSRQAVALATATAFAKSTRTCTAKSALLANTDASLSRTLVSAAFSCSRSPARASPFPPTSTAAIFKLLLTRKAHTAPSLAALDTEAAAQREAESAEETGCGGYSSTATAPTAAPCLAENEEKAAPHSTQNDGSTVYLGNIPWEVNKKDIFNFFRQSAAVLQVNRPLRKPDGRPRGYAFVTLADPAQVDRVIEETNGKMLLGRQVVVQRIVPEQAKTRVNAFYKERITDTFTLFVYNLPYGATAEDIGKHYLSFGEIKAVYIPRNFRTGELARYAFVRFAESAAADKAAEATNNSEFLGRTIFARLATAPRREPCKLLIRNLPFATTSEQLEEYYGRFGPIKFVHLPARPVDNGRYGFGFVEFETADAARKAVDSTNEMDFHGRQLIVRIAEKPIREAAVKPVDPETVVFIGNLSSSCGPADVVRFFSDYGQVEHAVVPTNPVDNLPRGFGIVRFASRDDAQKAINETKGKIFMDRVIFPKIKYYPTIGNNETLKSEFGVYVKALPSDTTPGDIGTFFSQFGRVLGVQLPKLADSGRPTRYGFVYYATAQEADQAVIKGNGTEFRGKIITVNFRK